MLVAPVEERGRLRLMYRSTLGGGVYDATVANGVVRAVLRSKATVEVAPRGDGTLTWASADGAQVLTAPLFRGAVVDEPPGQAPAR